jgi:ABC-type glycerol-3-phosphate transport system permease component
MQLLNTTSLISMSSRSCAPWFEHRHHRPGTFVSLIIPLAVFFAFQRYFVQGLLAGSVK